MAAAVLFNGNQHFFWGYVGRVSGIAGHPVRRINEPLLWKIG
jgi:hypothetical protein